MAKHKDPEFKRLLWSFRKKRMRAPVWTYLKTGKKKRLLPRFTKIHWRRTDFGRRIRRMIE